MARLVAAAVLLGTVVWSCASPVSVEPAVVLRVVLADDWASAPVVREVLERFEQDHDGALRIDVQGVPFSQIRDLVVADQDLDRPFDLVQWHAFAAGAQGIAQPLDDLWVEADLDPQDYLDGALEHVTWDGRRYGVPLDTSALVLLVNLDALEGSGSRLEQLATPAGFRAAADAVVASGQAEHAINVTGSSWVAYGWIRALGGGLLAPSGDPDHPTFTFTDPGTVQALDLLDGLIRDGLAPDPVSQPLALDAVGAFARGEVAMHATGSWDVVARHRVDAAVPRVAVVGLPQADPAQPRTVLGGSSLFVPHGSEHRALAFALMLALTADDVALRLATEEGRLPARRSALAALPADDEPLLAEVVDALDHAEVMPLTAHPQASASFAAALEEILAGRTSPREAMQVVQRQLETNGESR